MNRLAVINIVALTRHLIGEHTPFLSAWGEKYGWGSVAPVLPAVTCSAQSTYLTGKLPQEHGIVGNGWYDRTEAEVKFWKQSNHWVEGDKLWHIGKKEDDSFTVANICWWYNMYSDADYTVTPRPMYPADGRKIPDVYTKPSSLRDELQQKLGTFPLFKFWGPVTSIESSRWIAEAAIETEKKYSPTLSLVYLPHLDYGLQKFGNDFSTIGKDLQEIDALVQQLVTFYEQRDINVVLLSEYGITDVNTPIHPNRILREKGWLQTRLEMGRELLDAGASPVFAVADHQIAHIYCQDESILPAVKQTFANTKGIQLVLDKTEQAQYGIDHHRSGELVLVADSKAWFTYYYWLDDDRAPDFARTVDIHRKPGYDPVEMFIDPNIAAPKLKLGAKLIAKKLGFRTLMDVIPLDATLIKGSHGRIEDDDAFHPVFSSNTSISNPTQPTEVMDTFLRLVFGKTIDK